MRKTGPLRLALVGLMAGKLADEIQLNCKILKILYRLNYFDFHFVYSSAVLLIVLELTVGFSQTTHILGYVLWCVKFGRHFFHVDYYYLVLASVIPIIDW